jgi:hypothetical protein
MHNLARHYSLLPKRKIASNTEQRHSMTLT